MDLLPILSTLRRHKTAASLIVIEVAITSAIVCNALHLIANRLTLLNHDSGLPETELVVLEVRGIGAPVNADATTVQDMQALRALPGVKGVAVVNQVLYGNSSNNSGAGLDPAANGERVSFAAYEGGVGTLATMGLRLVEGRDFRPEETLMGTAISQQARPLVSQGIVNRALAERLWPGQPAVGKVVYVFDDAPTTVVGVVERLTHPQPGKARSPEGYAMLMPVTPSYRSGSYLLRVDPAQIDAVLRAAPGAIERVDASRIVRKILPLAEMRARYYAQDRSMVWLMGGVCIALLVVTAFGIVGLASFWVQQRHRMIGVRRALGASRRQILGYFQAENLLLTGIGIVLGMVGAFAVNQVLMASYEMQRLPWSYLPVGAVVLLALGQIAVLGPALRAAALPPVAVMRGL